MAEGFSTAHVSTDFYKAIGLDRNASSAHIKKRIHSLAKELHPDKTHSTDTEGMMKELNKIKSILLDKVEKKKYDEDLAMKVTAYIPLFKRENRGKILLPPTIPHSNEYNHLYSRAKKQFAHFSIPNSQKILEDFDRDLASMSKETMNASVPASRKVKLSVCKKPESKLATVNIASSRYDTVDDNFCEFETIRSTLKKIQNGNSTALAGDTVPILNVTKASASDLRSLLSLFTLDVPESATRKEIADKLSKFIPVTTVQMLPTKSVDGKLCAGCSSKPYWFSKHFRPCSWCNRQFCRKCPLEVHHYPRVGLATCALCTECIDNFTQQDASDWAEASNKFLARPNEESIMVSLGCASIAMALGTNTQELLRKIAKELHGHGMHTLSYNILSLAISQSDELYSTNEMKLNFLASSILKSLSKDQTKTWEEKWSFGLASKEAFVTALDIGMVVENDAEIFGDRSKGLKEIEEVLHHLLEEKKGKHQHTIFHHIQSLEALWQKRDVLKMLNFLREIAMDDSDISAFAEESMSVEAFKSFLNNKEPFLLSMLPEDRQALVFLKGVMKLKEEKIESALVDFESIAWNSSQSISEENVLSAYLYILSNRSSEVYSYEELKHTFESGSNALLFSKPVHSVLEERSMSLLFPSDEELTPPFKPNWPSLSVVGHNTRCHQKYEEAVMKLYDEKKWSNMKVSCAYMDDFPGCDHPAEMAVCYLHAAMSMARNFSPQSKIDPSMLFGYKTVLTKLLITSYVIAQKYLNPGMELYVNRLILGILRKLALVPGSKVMFTDEDTFFLQELLKRQLKVSRMFPFWRPPSVSISEAVLLNIITRKLHSNFLLELQYISPNHRLLTDLDLNYQLYENDLRSLLPLENSSDTRARAMSEMLKSQDWSFSDVKQTMSSQLCPRDQEGWIIQTPQLGLEQEYYDITGFVVDTDADRASIELLVVKASPKNGRIGLFSQEDIKTMLQLDLDDLPLFFSLDPPSQDLDKQYHPFQQWRYATEKVKDTEVLNTMFITDYLMKSFTVGSDVSSMPPFKQRPCKDGLTKNLPPKLQEAIRSIHERGGAYSRSSSHRFWIETKEIKFDCQQHGSRVEFRFGEMEMEVKSHSLFRGADGSLNDADEDDDPQSPHATFARDMTENFCMLGEYFPVFARLQQLSKLQLFSCMFQSLIQSIKEQSEGKDINISKEKVREIQEDTRRQHRSNVSTALTEMKQKVGDWPTAENSYMIRSKVNEIKSAIREEMRQEEERLYRIHGYGITIDNSSALSVLNGVESSVIEAFRSNDESALTQITSALKSSIKIPNDYHVKQYVRDWLSSSAYNQTPTENLITYLCSHLPVPTYSEIYNTIVSHHQERYQALSGLIQPFKKPQKPKNMCKWVPAAISPTSFSISYGGVAFNIKAVPIRDGERLPQPRNETRAYINYSRTPVVPQTGRVTYSAPKGNAQSKSSQGSSGSSNDSGSGSSGNKGSSSGSTRLPREAAAAASNDDQRSQTSKPSETAKQKRTIEGIVKGSSSLARPTVSASSFRENKAPGVNDHLDRLRHGVNTATTQSPPGNGGKKSGGGGGGGIGGGGGGNNYITGYDGGDKLSKACRSPADIINPNVFRGLPLSGSGGRKNSGDTINGLYVIRNKETGQVYVGRSCDIFRRTGQHIRDILNGRKTVGSFISSLDKMEFGVLQLQSDLSSTDMRFYEQHLLTNVKELCGKKVMNRINAMKEEAYNQLAPSMGL